MSNAIAAYNTTTICNESYPEGVFMTYDAPSTFYTLFKAAPILYSGYLTATGSKMGLVAGVVTNFIVTYLSDCFATDFRNLAIEQAQGRDVDWREGFSFDERDSLLQYGTVAALAPRTTTSVARTIANQGWNTYLHIGPLEKKLEGKKVADLISNAELVSQYNEVLQKGNQFRDQLILMHEPLKKIKELETFFESILNALMEFEKIEQLPYYRFRAINEDQEQIKAAITSMKEFLLTHQNTELTSGLINSMINHGSFTEVLWDIGGKKSTSHLHQEFKTTLRCLWNIFIDNQEKKPKLIEKLASDKEKISQLVQEFDSFVLKSPSFSAITFNENNKRQLLQQFEDWQALNKLRSARNLPEYHPEQVVGKTPESWCQRMWHRTWLDLTFKGIEVAGLFLQIYDFVKKQFEFSDELRQSCFEQVEANKK